MEIAVVSVLTTADEAELDAVVAALEASPLCAVCYLVSRGDILTVFKELVYQSVKRLFDEPV